MEIKVFGMENCAGCVTVKEILTANGVEFVELDVMNADHMAEAQKYGVRGVPTVVINRSGVEYFFTGSTKPTVDSLLRLVGA